MSANTKEEFLEKIYKFINEDNDKSIVFEVFTDSALENEALKIVDDFKQLSFTRASKKIIKKTLGEKNIKRIKKVLKGD